MGQSRNENILENMLGASNPVGEPQSRVEELLIDIYNQGGGGGDVETIQPDDFPTLPYPIVRNALGHYSTQNDIFAQKAAETYTHFYIDSVNGSDTNDGSENSPVKTFKKACQLALSKAAWNKAYFHIAEGSVFWDSDLYGEYQVKADTLIEGNGCTMIWGVNDPEWSAYEGVSGAYVSRDLTSQKCGAVIEISDSNKDMYGLYRGYKPVASAANLTAGTYYWDSTNNLMYVYPRTGANISNIYPLRQSYGLRWSFASSPSDAFLYMKGVNYIGNHYMASRSSSYPQTGKTLELFYEDCQFSHCFAGDLLGISNLDNAYLINCIGGYSKADLFNHHANSMTSEALAAAVYVNLNCKATEAGWYETNNTTNNINLYTAHDGMNILRLNCCGSNSHGIMLADVNGCRSVNYDINIINNAYSSTTITASVHFNNEQAAKEGYITLVNVYAADILHSTSHRLYTDCKTEMKEGNLWEDIVVDTNGELITI